MLQVGLWGRERVGYSKQLYGVSATGAEVEWDGAVKHRSP